jgi:hypothetical protein
MHVMHDVGVARSGSAGWTCPNRSWTLPGVRNCGYMRAIGILDHASARTRHCPQLRVNWLVHLGRGPTHPGGASGGMNSTVDGVGRGRG